MIHMQATEVFPNHTICAPRTCYRCGARFEVVMNERICPDCRKATVENHKTVRAPHLTSREEMVVAIVAEGVRNKEIAARLLVTEGTIKVYVSRILTKLRMTSRTELAVYWTKLNTGSQKRKV